jgi:crotonobetainyl-CoA:carnitine CoA-transferase CaiB-like acyl-CoA transferase
VKCGAPITDITAGILAAMGVLAAYAHRLKTGEGQQVDTSLFEAGVVQTYWQSAIALATGVSPGPMDSAHPLNAPYQAFQTADGWITIGAANQANWLRMLDVLGAQDLASDPRFGDNPARMRNRAALEEALTAYLRRRSSAEWLERFETAGVPAGPVLSVADMHADPQTLARDMVVEVEHARAGAVRTLGLPVAAGQVLGDARLGPQRRAPLRRAQPRHPARARLPGRGDRSPGRAGRGCGGGCLTAS